MTRHGRAVARGAADVADGERVAGLMVATHPAPRRVR